MSAKPRKAKDTQETITITPDDVGEVPAEFLSSEVELPVMLFGAFVFRDGLNITVRKGTGWDGVTGVVSAQSTDGESGQSIRIIDTLVTPFSELNEGKALFGLIQFEHDPHCRTSPSSLFQVMRQCYPPATPTSSDDFSWEDVVTIVFFTAVQ